MGAILPQMRTVYRAPETRASVPRSGGAIGVQASLLEDLALRVNLDDRLLVDDAYGGVGGPPLAPWPHARAGNAKNAQTLRSWPAPSARASDLQWGRSYTRR